MKKGIAYFTLMALMILSATSCEKRLEVKTDIQIAEMSELITNAQDAQRVLNSAYDVMANVFDGDIQTLAELLSDNAAQPSNQLDLKAVYDRQTTYFNSTINGIYSDLYRCIFRANLVIGFVDNASDATEAQKAQWIAEARFLRALCHFYVLKVYAQPWGYTPDNSHLGIVLRDEATQLPKPRATVAQSYDFIQADLAYAYNNLPTSNDVYATKYAAAALLSYTYWMQNNYSACIQYADEVINSNQFTLDPDVDIFNALDSVQADNYTNTPEGIFFAASYIPQSDARNDNFRNYIPGGTPAMLSMSSEFLQFMQLNAVDKRYTYLTDYNSAQGQTHSLRFGTQVQNWPFFSVPILRLTILKLIRAESLAASGGDLSIARADLDALRQRAFPDGVDFHLDANLTASQIVTAAWDEFRRETFCEGLWLDVLRRRGAMGENIVIREAPWNCPGMAIQFPNSEGTGAGFIFNPERGCN